jgi:hypothetical protein
MENGDEDDNGVPMENGDEDLVLKAALERVW